MTRAVEAVFFGAPEAKAYPLLGRFGSVPGKLQRGFEHRRRAAAVIVDARALGHAVEVRADDDQLTVGIGGSVRQRVASHALTHHGVDCETHVDAAAGSGCKVERATKLV